MRGHPMERQPNPFPYGCWGHRDITGSAAGDRWHQAPDRWLRPRQAAEGPGGRGPAALGGSLGTPSAGPRLVAVARGGQ